MESASYNSIHLINKGMYYAIGLVVVFFILDVQGSLRNTQCKRTQDWNSYQFQCSKDHTIYFKHHIIEDGFQMLSYSDTFLGCKETDAVYCGTKLPINQTLGQNSAAFVSAVSDCNGKIKCNVSGQYFKDIEASVRKLCSQSSHPELNKASFRQSIEYECIQDYQVIEMCTNRRDSRSPHAYLQSSGDGGNCSCEMTGNISRLEILQTAMAELLISNESSPLFEHQNSDVSLYGVEVPVITKKLLIHIQGRSAASRILIKVLGNLTIHCDELKSTSAVQYQGHVSTVLSFTETRQIGEQMVIKSSTRSLGDIRRAFQGRKNTSTRPAFLMTSVERKSTLNLLHVRISSENVKNQKSHKKYDRILDAIQLFFSGILILLMIFLIRKKRLRHSKSIQINDKGERFVLVFPPKQKDNNKSIKIHRPDCLCNQSEENETQTSPQDYTPLHPVNEISTYTELNQTNDYIDVVHET